MLKVEVSFKARLGTLACFPQMDVELKDGANLDELMKICLAKNHEVKAVIANKDADEYRAILVCNGRFCGKNHLLKEGDKIAVYSLSSGG